MPRIGYATPRHTRAWLVGSRDDLARRRLGMLLAGDSEKINRKTTHKFVAL